MLNRTGRTYDLTVKLKISTRSSESEVKKAKKAKKPKNAKKARNRFGQVANFPRGSGSPFLLLTTACIFNLSFFIYEIEA